MRFAILASGSKGNAALVEHRNRLVLVDCGLSFSELNRRMESVNSSVSDITDVLLTHEHGDHIRGVVTLSKRTGIVPRMTRGTAHRLKLGDGDFAPLRSGADVDLGDGLVARPYTIPHDAREAVQFRFCAGKAVLTFATDIGKVNDHVVQELSGSNAIVLECNYDFVMLEGNPNYPRSLKNRISGGKGHMSNEQASSLLGQVAHEDLRVVVAAHLSENNNTPDLATKALGQGLNGVGHAPQIVACPQGDTLDWMEVTPAS